MPRPLTPKEKWHEQASESYATLHANIHPFGCLVVAHEPTEKRAKDAAKGTEGVYLCQCEGGHSVLIISTGAVVKARTVECNHDVFPCEEASKRDNTYHVPWLDPRDRRSSELEPIAIEETSEKANMEVASTDMQKRRSATNAHTLQNRMICLGGLSHTYRSPTFSFNQF